MAVVASRACVVQGLAILHARQCNVTCERCRAIIGLRGRNGERLTGNADAVLTCVVAKRRQRVVASQACAVGKCQRTNVLVCRGYIGVVARCVRVVQSLTAQHACQCHATCKRCRAVVDLGGRKS